MKDVLPSQLYLWDKRTLYIGPLSEPIELSQGAATLTVSLTGPIEFTTPNMEHPIRCNSLLLPPGFDISVNTFDAVIANCNLDPVGSDWNALSHRMKNKIDELGYDLDCEDEYRFGYEQIYQQQMPEQQAYDVLEQLLDLAFKKLPQSHKVDERILSVIDVIKTNIDDNMSVDDLAGKVNLSVPRLVQLFKQQTGVPIRRYRQWHRLYTTAVKMGQGYNLTEAALAAGFSDSAHFTNTFRTMLGMKPSVILSQPNQIRINIPSA